MMRDYVISSIQVGALIVFLAVMCGCATQLDKAIDSGDLNAAKIAIQQGANVSTKWYESPIHDAVHENNLEMVRLLRANGAPIDQCYLDTGYPDYWNLSQSDYYHDSLPPLGSAIARYNAEMVGALLDLGAPTEHTCKVAFVGSEYHFSAIMVAAEFGDAEVVSLLLGKGQNPNRLADSFTPLSIAAYRGHYQVARVLLAGGAFHTYSNQIKQPIEHALDAGNEDIVNLLVYAGAVRPRRADPSKVMESIADTLVDGVIFLGTIALIVEGSKYAGYQDSYISSSSSSGGRTGPPQSQSQSTYSSDDNQCNSDFQCTVLQICLKKPGHLSGICVRDAGNTRLSGERDSVSSGFPRPLDSYGNRDCPIGTHWDLIYQACVE